MDRYQARIQDFEMGGEFLWLRHGNEAFLDYMLDCVFMGSK